MAFSIEINCDDAGAITVNAEPADQEAQESAPSSPDQGGMDAETPPEPQGQPAKDIDDALQIAKQMYDEQSQGEQGGENPADGSAPITNQADAKAMWSQMAKQKDKARAMGGM